MTRKVAIFAGIVVVLSIAYDFWHGYRQGQSLLGGMVYAGLGVGVLVLFFWLMRPRSN
jgi:uncharacterized membrane protein YgaE (UPF0421/DUF939 family)